MSSHLILSVVVLAALFCCFYSLHELNKVRKNLEEMTDSINKTLGVAKSVESNPPDNEKAARYSSNYFQIEKETELGVAEERIFDEGVS